MVKKKLAILKIAAAVSMVLADHGTRITCPVMLTCDIEIQSLMKVLENSRVRVLTSFDKREVITEELVKTSPDPLIFIFDGSFKANSRLEMIISCTRAGQCLGKNITRLPIIVTDLVTPPEYREDLLQIHMGVHEDCKYNIWEMLATSEELVIVKDKIREIESGLPLVHKFLLSCLAFIYPRMKQNNILEEYTDFENVIADLVEKDNQAKDPSGITEMFIDRLYKFKKHGGKPKLAVLPKVEEDAVNNMDKYFFCNEKYLHMTDNLFKDVIGNLSKVIGINSIKQILADEAVLIKGSKRSYKSKMTLTTMHGDPLRLDVLKFDVNKLNELGRSDFFIEFGG